MKSILIIHNNYNAYTEDSFNQQSVIPDKMEVLKIICNSTRTRINYRNTTNINSTRHKQHVCNHDGIHIFVYFITSDILDERSHIYDFRDGYDMHNIWISNTVPRILVELENDNDEFNANSAQTCFNRRQHLCRHWTLCRQYGLNVNIIYI